MKHYYYDSKRYFMQVTFIGYFCIALILVSITMILTQTMTSLFVTILCISAYTVFNNFIAKTTPKTVSVDKDTIIFESYGKIDTYHMKEVSSIKIREFPSSGKMYIRMNTPTLLKGRFWVQTRMFKDGKDLFRDLIDIEYHHHPDSLKSKARRINTEYNRKAAMKKGG